MRKLFRSAAPVLALLGAGCGALDVSDPTVIEHAELEDAAGAELLRKDALRRLYLAVGEGGVASGLLADELWSDPPASVVAAGRLWEEEELDQRRSQTYEDWLVGVSGGIYARWQEVRRAAAVAMPKLQAYAPAGAAGAHVGEMFALRGFATLRLAEDFCPGFPLHDLEEFKPVYGPPLSTEEAMAQALADFDSALAYAADSARVLNFARVARGRVLLGLGRFAEARAAAADVPTEYVWNAEYNPGAFTNPLHLGQFGDLSRSVADRDGGTGLDYISADDPRVEVLPLGTANDGVTTIYGIGKYDDASAPVAVVSGIEARLIEAEALLNTDPESGTWLTILNTLRTNGMQDGDGVYQPGTGGVAGLAPLADPGTPAARVDLVFRERALWRFGTGQRLGDLRRLMSRYGRTSESVFPTGTDPLGDLYDTGTSIPFPATLEAHYNPAVTGCTSR